MLEVRFPRKQTLKMEICISQEVVQGMLFWSIPEGTSGKQDGTQGEVELHCSCN